MSAYIRPSLIFLGVTLVFLSTARAEVNQKIPVRLAPEKRKFTSEAVEQEIKLVTQKVADPVLAKIFELSYPNTLDTTVTVGTRNGKPDTFIITGDINAMWLRDSSAQVQAYLPLCKDDPHLAEMVAGLIHRQAACILIYPYANAFRKDPVPPQGPVFEGKWELDSLSYCVRLSYEYWKETGDNETFDQEWKDAMHLVVATMREQQRKNNQGPYHHGKDYGGPMKPTGMICTRFRNSDDPTVYLFNIPENLFAMTSLRQLAEMADVLLPGDSLATDCRALANEVQKGVEQYGTVNDPKYGKMYAYEVDGLGNTFLFDDAGLPSLVSIPYFTPSLAGDPVVLATRKWALSLDDPYFAQGTVAEGECSPHKGKGMIWPLGLCARVLTSTDDAEIVSCLTMLKRSSAGTGFMHESFNKDDATKYSRHWFAWANNLFGEMLIKVLRERPELLAKPIPD